MSRWLICFQIATQVCWFIEPGNKMVVPYKVSYGKYVVSVQRVVLEQRT